MKDLENSYPIINEKMQIRIQPEQKVNLSINSERKQITYHAWQVLKKCDGTKTINEIYSELQEIWDTSIDDILKLILDAEKNGYLYISNSFIKTVINVIGDESHFYPAVAAIVLTNKCNINCIYCYGNYKSNNKDFIDSNKIDELFKKLVSKGISDIELTGGEPLMHPNFKYILRTALEYFNSVSILSNGVLFDNETLDIIIKNKDKIAIQISIDGCTEETNSLVRGAANTWAKTLHNIKALTQIGVKLRIAYMLTRENLFELKATFEMMKGIGVKLVALSIVHGLGRGSNLKYSDGHALNFTKSPDFVEFSTILNDVAINYSDMMTNYSKIKEKFPNYFIDANNCGTGWNICSIYPNGDVYSCQLLGKDGPKLGNIFDDEIESIFNNNTACDFFRKFRKIGNEISCKGCNYEEYCGSCITKVFTANKDFISRGKGLCPIAIRNGMDKVFDFSKKFTYNI
jgi:radical SAM protein with 4Fe4S-binding SPASM domain